MQAIKPVSAGFSGDTQILTRACGWQRFDQITTADEVATRAPDGQFRWAYPECVIWQPYCGDMVWLHSRTSDLMVTPTTPILHRKHDRTYVGGALVKSEPVEFTGIADEFVGRRASMVATSRWVAVAPKRQITLASRPVRADGKRNVGKPPLEFVASSSDFAAFMGMYLSEGSIGYSTRPGEYPISICQGPRGKGFEVYQERLSGMLGREVPWLRKDETNGMFRFANKALHEYLETLGGYAWTKRIPPEILELATEDLETFWHFYWLGDGTTMRSAGRKDIQTMQTTSPVMADGLQEILQKLGGWSKIHMQFPKPGRRAPGGVIKSTRPTHILVRRAGEVACARTVERLAHDGHIGNVSVPHGAVYVRRNTYPVWAGSA